MRARIGRARKRHERQLLARQLGQSFVQPHLHRTAFGQRHRGLPLIRCQQGTELVVLPVLHHQVSPGVDHARGTHHEQPHQGDDAQQVVQVQPLQACTPLAPHGAKVQLAHEGAVQDGPADDGHQQQEAHQAKEQHAGQASKQVHMQLEHHPHEALIHTWPLVHLTRAGVHRHRAKVIRGSRCGRHGDEPQVWAVLRLRGVLHHAVRVLGPSDGQHLVEAEARCVGRHLARLYLRSQQVPDLMVKDQRQARDAQQQHERGTDQAAPFVKPGPRFDGLVLHGVLRTCTSGSTWHCVVPHR